MTRWLREPTVISLHTGNKFALVLFYPSEGRSGTKQAPFILPRRVIFFCFLVEEISTYKKHLLG
jgi:hypothetical protein